MRLFILTLIACLTLGFLVQAEEITKIIAKVNNQAITSKDLEDYCKVLGLRLSQEEEDLDCSNEKFRKEALEGLIEDKLILDQAKEEKIEVPQSWINSKLEQFIASYPSREEFEYYLLQKDLNITLLKDKIKEQYLMREIIDKYVKSYVSISPAEVNQYYLSNKEKFYSPLKYIFYIVNSKNAGYIREISSFINEKGIFVAESEYGEALVKLESNQEELKKDILHILSDLEKGGHKIKKIGGLYYLVYLEDIIQPRQLLLDEVQEQIYAQLWQEKFNKRFNEWVDELKSKAVVKIYDEK